jgi:hypothetical protein
MHPARERPARRPHVIRLVDCERARERTGDENLSREQVVRMERIERIAATRAGRCRPLFVVVVRIDRCYGGPEEGGWWYDWRSIEEVRRAWGFPTLRAAVRELRHAYTTCGPNRFSVIGSADYELFVTPHEGQIESLQSRERPTYA